MRKVILCCVSCLLVCAFSDSVLAKTPASDPALDVLASYQRSLLARADWEAETLTHHAEQVLVELQTLPSTVLGNGQFGTLIWSEKSRLLELWRENEMVPLSYYTDTQGRPAAMARDGTQVAVDIVGDIVHLRLVYQEEVSFWHGQINAASSGGGVGTGGQTSDSDKEEIVIVTLAPQVKCICKGSENVCADPDTDCINDVVCEYTDAAGNTKTSRCANKKVTGSY